MAQLFGEKAPATPTLEIPLAARGIGFFQVGFVANQNPRSTMRGGFGVTSLVFMVPTAQVGSQADVKTLVSV